MFRKSKLPSHLATAAVTVSFPSFSGGLEILDGPKPENILIGPRVGIEYALPEHVNALWRFAVAGSPWVSAPRNTLHLPP